MRFIKSRKPNPLYGWLIGLFIPILVALAGVAIFQKLGVQKPEQVAEDPSDPRVYLSRLPIVSTESVAAFQGLETLDIQLSGTVVPYRQLTIAAEVAGRVIYKSELCRIGRYVHAGDVLFRLNPRDYELEVERLTAMKESEYAQQRELDQELSNIKRSMKVAEEELLLQEKEIKRLDALPQGVASDTERDQARSRLLSSTNQVVTLQNQLQLLESRRTRIELAEKLADTQLSQAQTNLERAEVKSPISGVIVSESVQEDSYVQRGDKLFVIEDTDRVEVSCNLRTDQLLLVLDQLNANATADPSSQVMRASSYELPPTPVEISYQVAGRSDLTYQWHGHLSRYEGIGLDAQSRTVPVRITVEDPRDVKRNGQPITEEGNGGLPALVRGMFVDVKIQTKPKRSLVLLPKLAVRPGGQVWVFEPDESLMSGKKISETVSESAAENLPTVLDWTAGRVRVVNGVKTINVVRVPTLENREYWVAEAIEGLQVDSLLVTTPLANLIGDGTDQVKAPKAMKGSNP
jgi:multidrug efflux pump subunit AcrA (membrane-fusion protein)